MMFLTPELPVSFTISPTTACLTHNTLVHTHIHTRMGSE